MAYKVTLTLHYNITYNVIHIVSLFVVNADDNGLVGVYAECCGTVTYDSETHECCENDLFPARFSHLRLRHPGRSYGCCERLDGSVEVYDIQSETCSTSPVVTCRGVTYDPVQQRCCQGIIFA